MLGPFGCQFAEIHFAARAVTPPEFWKKLAKMVGNAMIEMAKMIGMTPPALTRRGRKLRRPCTAWPARGLTTRCADWIGIFRCACWTSMMKAVTEIATTVIMISWRMWAVPPVVA